MKKSNDISLTRPKSYIKIVIALFLIVFAGKFIVNDALPYFQFTKEAFGRYWDFKWSLIGHVSSGIIALIIGPFQFWKAFRNKNLTLHRWLGRTYLIVILFGSICSTILAWTSAININFAWAFGLQGLAFAWIITLAMAYVSVRRKKMVQHREWMIRSYAITFAFVTFRWLNALPLSIKLMDTFEERGPTLVWLSWVIPLLITNVILS